MESRNVRQDARASQRKPRNCGQHEKVLKHHRIHQARVKIVFLALLCDISVKLTSGAYGSQLEAKLIGRGCQASDALLAIAVFVGRYAFVDVGLAPSQQPVNQSSP